MESTTFKHNKAIQTGACKYAQCTTNYLHAIMYKAKRVTKVQIAMGLNQNKTRVSSYRRDEACVGWHNRIHASAPVVRIIECPLCRESIKSLNMIELTWVIFVFPDLRPTFPQDVVVSGLNSTRPFLFRLGSMKPAPQRNISSGSLKQLSGLVSGKVVRMFRTPAQHIKGNSILFCWIYLKCLQAQNSITQCVACTTEYVQVDERHQAESERRTRPLEQCHSNRKSKKGVKEIVLLLAKDWVAWDKECLENIEQQIGHRSLVHLVGSLCIKED